jgi:hypothetical protein
MEIILQILALMKNQSLDRCKQISQFIAHENGFGCVQIQSVDRCKQTSQYIAHENGFGASKTNPYTDANKLVNL